MPQEDTTIHRGQWLCTQCGRSGTFMFPPNDKHYKREHYAGGSHKQVSPHCQASDESLTIAGIEDTK